MHLFSAKAFSITILLAALTCLVSQPALSRSAPKITMAAISAATYAGVLPTIGKSSFKPSQDAQFYTLSNSGKTIGYLYSETQNWEGNNRGPCSLAWFNPENGRASKIKTIGADDFEAETCGKLDAIGVLDHQHDKAVEIGTVYSASSPNAEVHEPVVVMLDLSTDRLGIDAPASSKASDAGAATISAIKKVVRK